MSEDVQYHTFTTARLLRRTSDVLAMISKANGKAIWLLLDEAVRSLARLYRVGENHYGDQKKR